MMLPHSGRGQRRSYLLSSESDSGVLTSATPLGNDASVREVGLVLEGRRSASMTPGGICSDEVEGSDILGLHSHRRFPYCHDGTGGSGPYYARLLGVCFGRKIAE
jgi:hypothetical protein